MGARKRPNPPLPITGEDAAKRRERVLETPAGMDNGPAYDDRHSREGGNPEARKRRIPLSL